MMLLRNLHTIAEQRGDGLLPELLERITPSRALSAIERTDSPAIVEDADAASLDPAQHVRSAEVGAMPPQRRG